MDEASYRALKKLEIACSNLSLELPFPESEVHKRLKIEPWKIPAISSLVGDLMKAARDGATAAYMQGKE